MAGRLERPKMSAAGIVDDPDTRERIIPESRRADGSIRKERRVKPGFTPAEDVGRFRPSRVLLAEAEKQQQQQQQGGKRIPGYVAPGVTATRMATTPSTSSLDAAPTASAAPVSKPSDGDWRKARASDAKSRQGQPSSQAAALNGSWRSKGKVATATVPDDWEAEEDEGQEAQERSAKPAEEVVAQSIDPIRSPEEDGKRARSLGKKIKAAQSLQERQREKGETLLVEQQAKVDQLEDMIRDLRALDVKE